MGGYAPFSAQGNQHDKIEPFIEYLLDGLNSDKGIDLNYIYGIEDDKKETFSPIDGQQRLTTLWLLRMYLISRANIINPTDKKVLDQKLVYQTREYAHDFLYGNGRTYKRAFYYTM